MSQLGGGVNSSDIAIIGMAGRFPRAENPDQLWTRLQNGEDLITHFSLEELQAHGVPASLLNDPNYVRAAPVLKDVEHFDAAFFGITPREAEIIDPQQRFFLELCWAA